MPYLENADLQIQQVFPQTNHAFMKAGAAWVSVDSSIDELGGILNQQRPGSRNKVRANVSTHPNADSNIDRGSDGQIRISGEDNLERSLSD